MGLSHSPRIVTDGLVFCVDAGDKMSYPGAGTTWTDLSKNRNNGTLTNGPTFDSANGGSIVFDGTNDRVDCGNSTSLNFGNSSSDFPFSIVSWAKFDSFSSTNPIFARGEGDGSTNGIEYTLTTGSDLKAKFSAAIIMFYIENLNSREKIYDLLATANFQSKFRDIRNEIIKKNHFKSTSNELYDHLESKGLNFTKNLLFSNEVRRLCRFASPNFNEDPYDEIEKTVSFINS